MRSRADDILDLTLGPSVLHIGCLGGQQHVNPALDSPHWIHRRLLRAHPDVWGIDLDEARLDVARKAGIPNLHRADAQRFDLGRAFDTVVAGEVIEHLANPGLFLECAARHMKPGGRIVLTTPYALGMPNVLYAWVKYPKTCSNPEHTMWFCPSTLAVLADQHSLQVSEWRLIDDYPVSGWSRYELIARAFRRAGRVLPRRIRCNGLLVSLETSSRRLS